VKEDLHETTQDFFLRRGNAAPLAVVGSTKPENPTKNTDKLEIQR
jgi:hypothetical protein